MKKKIVSIIGLALFLGAVVFNVNLNAVNNQSGDVTLNNIKVLEAAGDMEIPCEPWQGETCDYRDDGGMLHSVSNARNI